MSWPKFRSPSEFMNLRSEDSVPWEFYDCPPEDLANEFYADFLLHGSWVIISGEPDLKALAKLDMLIGITLSQVGVDPEFPRCIDHPLLAYGGVFAEKLANMRKAMNFLSSFVLPNLAEDYRFLNILNERGWTLEDIIAQVSRFYPFPRLGLIWRDGEYVEGEVEHFDSPKLEQDYGLLSSAGLEMRFDMFDLVSNYYRNFFTPSLVEALRQVRSLYS